MRLSLYIRWFPRYIRRLTPCIALLTAGILPLIAFPQIPAPPATQPYWQQQVNYSIDVSLDATELTLDGFAKIEYTNRSPDTLSFIWFQLWPNAYKNDQTAFSEQLLGNGRTDFYFSDQGRHGYINRLDFRVDGAIATTGDHPQYIDIIKIILPRPLLPGGQTMITTPFHVQLPFDFSRGGYAGGNFQIAEWYPQPAVYDRYGWHPLPYLDQGGSYSEFGNFDVRITAPAAYKVVATGAPYSPDTAAAAQTPAPSTATRTFRFRQDNIRDFAWFADKYFKIDHDTLQLPSGRIIDLYACYRPASASLWKDCIQYMKDAARFRSASIGEYPFATLSAVEVNSPSARATEYPGLIAIPLFSMHMTTMVMPASPKHPRSTYKVISDITVDSFSHAINHEISQQWFSSILGANERRYPWMGDGLSAWYDKAPPHTGNYWSYDDYTIKKMPADPHRLSVDILAAVKKDQPISTSSEDFNAYNYNLIPRYKTELWLERLRQSLGSELFDSCMRQYYRRWAFKHPYPEDFRSVIENTSHRQLDSLFALLDKNGPIPCLFPDHRKIKATAIYSRRNTDKIDYINIGPALGYNHYDQFMIGAYVHNLDLPPNHFQFLAAPLYATNSNRLNGIGGLSYSWYPDGAARRILLGLTGSRFSTISGIDSNGKKIFGGFYKMVPTLRLTLKKQDPRSTLERWMEWKTYLIGEKGFDSYVLKSSDSNYYPVTGKYDFRYLNQLSFGIEDQRALYPYQALLQFQQAGAWWRINFTGNYFFNYERGGGLALRLFAAKFGYIGGKNAGVDLSSFQPKLTGVTGGEDYTYSNYFLGRNEFTGLASQQIMMRDGGLKIRTDLFQGLQGRSDNWVAAINLNSSLPTGLLPSWLPLKLFLDLGTYAEAWQNDPPTRRFLFVSGFQLTPFRDFNIYAPLFYSSDFGNQLKTVPDQNGFFKKISFSIDFQTLKLGKGIVDNPF